MSVQDLERIEKKLDLSTAGAVSVSDAVGGIMFQNMAEVMEFAKLLSLAQNAVPKHIRGNPGAALAVTIQALEWRMSPVAVANMSYEVGDKIAYMSQLIHGVVEARAPLKQRLRCSYEGEGPDRVCIVVGHFRGEADPVEYRSPKFKDIKPKNSPLWQSDPDQQQWYYSVRAFARRYCPDVLLGIYTEDELENNGADRAVDITPKPDIGARLKGRKGRGGFNEEGVAAAIEHRPEASDTASEAPAEEVSEQKSTLSAGEIEAEIAAKKTAIQNADTKEDLDALFDAGKAFLKEHGRNDLLADLMSVANARGKKIKA